MPRAPEPFATGITIPSGTEEPDANDAPSPGTVRIWSNHPIPDRGDGCEWSQSGGSRSQLEYLSRPGWKARMRTIARLLTVHIRHNRPAPAKTLVASAPRLCSPCSSDNPRPGLRITLKSIQFVLFVCGGSGS